MEKPATVPVQEAYVSAFRVVYLVVIAFGNLER